MTVDAVVVTYNRIEKLKECLNKLAEFNLENIYVIDNASSDGTGEYVHDLANRVENVTAFNLKKNLGGAGGFNYGLKKFIQESISDYAWIMDDDTIPESDSLELLVQGIESERGKVGFATGQVYWIDGTLAQMNIPVLSRNSHTNSEYNYVVEASFVAILFSRIAIEKIGYPITDFFIWGDDVEYTQRVNKNGLLGIQVKNARIIHKMNENVGIDILNENSNKDRIERYFYNYRNRLYLSRKNGLYRTCRSLCGRVVGLGNILVKSNNYKMLKIKVLIKGTLAGLFFNPPIEK
ncbi:glycosyltransferase family 2 protein [Companilactobacillus mishanensis]|uniref:glycosyltransferase family 2 protein n=1 Tax=Companilactobacillus mishanensis TaxID=2486008 RepID=UPI0012979171|nr:glycosyltransferase family 2 protein [Companilactobacillus mishanensis]MQS88861.1 glycosyltransferase [Companilactobacillus mishanensis]